MSGVRDSDAEVFIKDLENRRGARLTYRTFCTFYADNQGRVRDFGVFFYEADGVFWFEDFEHETNLFGFRFTPKRRRDEKPFEKYEGSFSPSQVVSIRLVRKSDVKLCVRGLKDFSRLRCANTFTRLFSETASEIKLNDGRALYFQFIDKTVENKVKQYHKEN